MCQIKRTVILGLGLLLVFVWFAFQIERSSKTMCKIVAITPHSHLDYRSGVESPTLLVKVKATVQPEGATYTEQFVIFDGIRHSTQYDIMNARFVEGESIPCYTYMSVVLKNGVASIDGIIDFKYAMWNLFWCMLALACFLYAFVLVRAREPPPLTVRSINV